MDNNRKQKKQYEPKVKNVPNNEELEKAILSMIMMDAEVATDIFAKVKEEDFYTSRNREIYKLLYERNKVGASFDMLGVISILTAEISEKIGGIAYLTEVANTVYSTATYEDDIKYLKQLATLRNIIKITDIVDNRVYNNESCDDIISYAQGELYNLGKYDENHELEPVSKGIERVIGDIQDLIVNGESRKVLSTGFKNLDSIANGGFLPGQMIVLAARPGCGKTSFAMDIVSNVANKSPEKVIAVFNLEMTKDELIKRMLSTNTGINSQLISRPYGMSNEQIKKIYDAKPVFENAKIFIDDTSNITMNDINLKVRRLQNKQGSVDLVVIDHMQLIADSAKGRSRYEMMTEISRMVKIMAKEIEVPVVVLSQMSRGFEKDEIQQVPGQAAPKQRDPKMSDLRESGAIEQDADMVLFLTEGDFRVEEGETALNVVVAKNRSGESDTKLHFGWNKGSMSFREVEHAIPVEEKQQDEDEEDIKEPQEIIYDEPVPPEDTSYPSSFMDELRQSAGDYKGPIDDSI